MSPTRWFARSHGLTPSEQFSDSDLDANALALGLMQIRTLPSGAWNDPTAPYLSSSGLEVLVDQWGVGTRGEWLNMIDFLATARRRRHAWEQHLGVRNHLATTSGRTPTAREWLAAIAADGGDARDAGPFVAGIERVEHEVRAHVGADVVTPELFVRTLDAYALGQAVAMATWGVALGYADVGEARLIIHRVNGDARRSFLSWADFGLSYLTGRVMHWSDGDVDDTAFDRFGDGWETFRAATRRGAPWAALPWHVPAEARSSSRMR